MRSSYAGVVISGVLLSLFARSPHSEWWARPATAQVLVTAATVLICGSR